MLGVLLGEVTAAREELERTDFLPFKLLADLPWAMTGHLLEQAELTVIHQRNP